MSMGTMERKLFVVTLRSSADVVEGARRLVSNNISVSARLRAIVDELRFTADAFEGDKHAKA